MFEVREYQSAEDFLAHNEVFMLKNESSNNLILGLANRMQMLPDFGDEKLFLAILKNGQIVAQALRSHLDKPLALTEMGEGEVKALVDYLISRKIEVHAVVGASVSSEMFLRLWKNPGCLHMHQGIYELTKVIMPKVNGLKLHRANKEDLSICQSFLEGFVGECFPGEKEVVARASEIAKRNVEGKNLYILQNEKGESLSIAAKVRESKNAGTVSLVYTPKELRGRGYGSLVTALVSKEIMNNGKQKCNLFTDMSNPTSNSIYQKIGYKKIGESKHFTFD